mgnify:FL=1
MWPRISKAPALFMPIATWPVNRLLPSSSLPAAGKVSRKTAHPSILTILKLFTTLLQGFNLISFSFFTPTIAIYSQYNSGSAFDLIAQDRPVKGKPHKAVWPMCLYTPAERPIPILCSLRETILVLYTKLVSEQIKWASHLNYSYVTCFSMNLIIFCIPK